MQINPSVLLEFFNETEEMLDRISSNLMNAHNSGSNKDKINELYRDVHSIKGNSYLFGLNTVGQVSHVMESLFDCIRSGKFLFSEREVSIVETGTDFLKKLIYQCKKNSSILIEEKDIKESIFISSKITDIIGLSLIGSNGYIKDDAVFFEKFDKFQEEKIKNADINIIKKEQSKNQKNIEEREIKEREIKEQKEKQKDKTEEKKEVFMEKEKIGTPLQKQTLEQASSVQEQQSSGLSTSIPQSNESLRVSVDILENLMNLVGELVLIRNQYIQHANENKDSEFSNLNQRLNHVTAELQEHVMKTRMQRIETVLSKFHRVVRDLSKTLNKKVSLKLVGADTELDRSILESIKDPLMHIVRNSLDHGIEGTEERIQKNKPEEGFIEIKSYHEGGQVIIEISDDGRGLNREKISAKVIEKKISTAEEIEKLSDRDVFLFVFAPGFSTAEKVSNVSGRGVGMDVVKTNIEKIGGVVDLSSKPDKGTIIKLKIPLTLAIIPALIIRSGGERFSIPQVKLIELVRVDNDDLHSNHKIEYLQDMPVYRLRGQLLPLVSLNKILGLPSLEDSSSVSIVVLNADSCIFGLIVDDIEDSNDIVIKPLMQFLKDLSIYSGATILGDGDVCLTIDVVGLANKAGIYSQSEFLNSSQKNQSSTSIYDKDRCDYLLMDIGATSKYGLPLSVINRLEEFQRDHIEYAGEQRVIRYRDSLLPILSICDYLKIGKVNQETKMCSVLVIERDHKMFGLEVSNIDDIISAHAEIYTGVKDRPGILGNIVFDQRVVVLLDAFRIIDDYLGVKREVVANNQDQKKIFDKRSKHKILLAEDSPFYRKHITEIVSGFGYQVISEPDGDMAYNRLTSHDEEIDVVVSDIEMPVLNGFEFAKRVRSNQKFQSIPMIALTSRYKKTDIEEGVSSGFNFYLEKLNGDQLVKTIDDILKIS